MSTEHRQIMVLQIVMDHLNLLSFVALSALASTWSPGCASLFNLLSNAPFALSIRPDILIRVWARKQEEEKSCLRVTRGVCFGK